VIFKDLRAQFGAAAAVTREFVALMGSTFAPYREIQSHLLDQLPHQLEGVGLASFITDELQGRLFAADFCERIPQSLKNLRRAIIRLEDLHEEHQDIPEYVNDLAALGRIAEAVEALYQQHWEYYRYQGGLTGGDVLRFLLEVHRIGISWDSYLSAFQDKVSMMESLEGRPAPEDMASLRVGYQRRGPGHFSVGTLRALVNFMEAAYRFVSALYEIDPEERPLALLHVEIAEPVELYLSLPPETEAAFRRLLQYLFLKDMLKRDALLKFVFQAVEKEHSAAGPLSTAQMTAFQKDLSAQVKELPTDGRFIISDRAFPDDEVRVLQEFMEMLEGQGVRYETLLGGDKAKASRKKAPKSNGSGSGEDGPADALVAEGKPAEAVQPPGLAAPGSTASGSTASGSTASGHTETRERERGHIRILTHNTLES